MQSLFPTSPSELSDDDLAQLYAYPHDSRWLRTNFVASLDGATQGGDLKSASLSSKADKRVFRLLRSLCDVIVAGAGTARAEGYQPVLPSQARTALRTQLGLAPLPAMAIVSRSLDLDDSLIAGGAAPTVIVTTESAPPERRRQVADVAPVIVAGELDVDVPLALEELASMGYLRMLCEGGPRLMRDLLAAGAVDEICLTLSPLLVGGDRLRLVEGGDLRPAEHLQLRHLLESDGQLFARYTKG